MIVTPPPVELLPVPTAAQLIRVKLAEAVTTDKDGAPTVVHVTAAGHDLMGAALLENGRRLRAWDEAQRG